MRNVFFVIFLVIVGWGFYQLQLHYPNAITLAAISGFGTLLIVGVLSNAIRLKKVQTIVLVIVVLFSSGYGSTKGFQRLVVEWNAGRQDRAGKAWENKMADAQTLDLDQRLDFGQTWLHIYSAGIPDCEPEKELFLVRCLIERGADVNAKDNNGETPMFWAVRHGKNHIVELLITNGARVNIKNVDDVTALFQAERLGNQSMVKLLRQHGAKTSTELDGQ